MRHLLTSVVIILAAHSVVAEDDDWPFKESEIALDGGVVRMIIYKNQQFRSIEPSQLKSLRIGSTQLDGLRVCVESKFNAMVQENYSAFTVMDSDRQFVFRNEALLTAVMHGDNIWVGGIAKRFPGQHTCYVEVIFVERLPGDFSLFERKFRALEGTKDWKRYIALSMWVDRQGKLNAANIVPGRVDPYQLRRTKAVREALRIRASQLSNNDADGHVVVAKQYIANMGNKGTAAATDLLLDALKIAPNHAKAAELIRSLGYVRRNDNTWVPRSSLEATVNTDNQGTNATDNTDTQVIVNVADEKKPVKLIRLKTDKRLIEITQAERMAGSGVDGIAGVATAMDIKDELLARHIVWMLANTKGEVGLKGLKEALKSPSIEVKKDVADALAWAGHTEFLAQLIRDTKVSSLKTHAVIALGGTGGAKSVDALISLLTIDDDSIRSSIMNELKRITGSHFERPIKWRAWWKQNKDAFIAKDKVD